MSSNHQDFEEKILYFLPITQTRPKEPRQTQCCELRRTRRGNTTPSPCGCCGDGARCAGQGHLRSECESPRAAQLLPPAHSIGPCAPTGAGPCSRAGLPRPVGASVRLPDSCTSHVQRFVLHRCAGEAGHCWRKCGWAKSLLVLPAIPLWLHTCPAGSAVKGPGGHWARPAIASRQVPSDTVPFGV